jgi:hypothetical protein
LRPDTTALIDELFAGLVPGDLGVDQHTIEVEDHRDWHAHSDPVEMSRLMAHPL